MTPWQVLGVGQDVGVSDLRRRYAALIKEFRPETHPQDFARIREAYEIALPHARHLELALEDEAVAAIAVVDAVDAPDAVEAPTIEIVARPDAPADSFEPVAPPPAADPFPAAAPIEEPSIEAEIATTDAAIGALLEAADDDAEPALAARFRQFHAAAESAAGTRDEAWLPELRALLQARARASLDDSQALEFALMRWFVEAESPPLTLLFETGRVFDWHAHVVRLSSWLSPWALRQMEARLALSRDLVYARHFSGNRWLRGLHSTRAVVALPFRPAALEALRWAERWRQASEDADAESLADSLDAWTLRRVEGTVSTDLLVGLAVAATQSDLVSAIAWGGGATLLLAGMRVVRQRVEMLPRPHRLRRVADVVMGNMGVVAVLSAIVGLLAAALFVTPDRGDFATFLGCVLIAPLTLLLARLAWRIAASLELLVAWAFHWREAVDRLEFHRFVGAHATPSPGAGFGPRLGWVARLRSMPEALRLQDVEIATRARPARLVPLTVKRIGGTRRQGQGLLARIFFGLADGLRGNPWRALWLGLWLVFAIVRMTHFASS